MHQADNHHMRLDQTTAKARHKAAKALTQSRQICHSLHVDILADFATLKCMELIQCVYLMRLLLSCLLA